MMRIKAVDAQNIFDVCELTTNCDGCLLYTSNLFFLQT